MGNCVFKGRGRLGVADLEKGAVIIKVVTPNGGVMELQAPITAETITNEFPGHAIFLSPGGGGHHISTSTSPPLHHHEQLCAGQCYHLLPRLQQQDTVAVVDMDMMMMPYRVSVDNNNQQQQGTTSLLKRQSDGHARYNRRGGVWKVRLAINSDQLSEILSQEARTEALIESVRAVAKCASGVPSPDHRNWTGNSTTDL